MDALEKTDWQQALEQKVHSAGMLFSDEERKWHIEQIHTGNTDEAKIDFYIWAATQREEILENAPPDKRKEITESIKKLLDQSSGSRREWDKGKPLRQMKEAVLQFRENQKLVVKKTRKLRNLPIGFESKIWDRFMLRFEKETSGDVLNPKIMENFRQSIETTFNHLAKVLDMQESIKAKFESEKYFDLKASDKSISERERLASILQTQIFDWLEQEKSLRDWEKGLGILLQKQLPKNLKEFKEHYSQIFTPEFWKNISNINPMEMPNFIVAFNFQTENGFMTKMSLADIKKIPKKIKKALLIDGQEILSEFFSEKERQDEMGKLKTFSEKDPEKLLKAIKNLRNFQDKKRNKAHQDLKKIKRLYFDKDTKTANAELSLFKKKYGTNVLDSLMEDKFQSMVDLRMMRIESLEAQLKLTNNSDRKKQLQSQLSELCRSKGRDHCDIDISVNERSERVLAIEIEVKMARASGDLTRAKSLAKKLRGLNDVKAELLISEINREIEANKIEEGGEEKSETKVETSMEKQKKIEFLEKSIEHAEKVKEACGQVGIPSDDPKFWKNEGIINRVQWLKDHGLYEMYQKFNGSDPNIPRDAQTGGFRFRWMDSRGSELNFSRATDGLKYLQRYKESGYVLAALAGAFTINWKGMSDLTYTPDEFIMKVNTDLNQLKGSVVG